MKICVIGNSHIASLKLGWDEICARYPDTEMIFFGARGTRMRYLIPKGDALVADDELLANSLTYTSGGLSSVHPKKYDLLVLYGLFLRVPALPVHVSKAVREAAARNCLERSLSKVVLDRIRQISDVPILIGHNPLPAHNQSDCHLPDGDRACYELVITALNHVLDAVDTEVLPQPEESTEFGFTTSGVYSSGSVRLAVRDGTSGVTHRSDDTHHMNGDFGSLWLEAMLRHVSGLKWSQNT